MADEISLTASLNINNGDFTFTWAKAVLIDQATAGGGSPGFVTIGTSEEDVAFGDCAPGVVVIQNLDDTNFVEFGDNDTDVMKAIGKVSPGSIAVFELNGVLRMKADTAAVNCQIYGFNT